MHVDVSKGKVPQSNYAFPTTDIFIYQDPVVILFTNNK
jgi:hypothetical protein